MPLEKTSRRRFLVCALVASAALTAGLNLPGIRAGAALAQATRDRSAQASKTLVDLIRSLFPHAALADDVYVEIVNAMLTAATDDPQLRAMLDQAVEALDAAGGKDFFELGEDAQLEVMQSLADSDFFRDITARVRWRLYTHPKLWEVIGYPGSSVEHGGYVDRGFNDIDWLPEDAG